MEYAKNLTANNNLEDIIPVGDRIVVILAWKYKRSLARELHGDQSQQYVTEVMAVEGEDGCD
jgi:hypothetical protein